MCNRVGRMGVPDNFVAFRHVSGGGRVMDRELGNGTRGEGGRGDHPRLLRRWAGVRTAGGVPGCGSGR